MTMDRYFNPAPQTGIEKQQLASINHSNMPHIHTVNYSSGQPLFLEIKIQGRSQDPRNLIQNVLHLIYTNL